MNLAIKPAAGPSEVPVELVLAQIGQPTQFPVARRIASSVKGVTTERRLCLGDRSRS